MVPNNSQDENIPILTEVWPRPMSREPSVWHYFGAYLQTSMKRFILTHVLFPLLAKAHEKD